MEKNETQPTVYYVFDKFETLEIPFEKQNWFLTANAPRFRECCFSNDSKFAVVFSTVLISDAPTFFVIDVDTGITAIDDIEHKKPSVSCHEVTKMFCTDPVIIRLTPDVIEIFDLKTWKRLEFSFQRYLSRDFVIHSKLSPKGTILAVPRLTGDMEFLQLHIPKQSSISNGQKNWDRVGSTFFSFDSLDFENTDR